MGHLLQPIRVNSLGDFSIISGDLCFTNERGGFSLNLEQGRAKAGKAGLDVQSFLSSAQAVTPKTLDGAKKIMLLSPHVRTNIDSTSYSSAGICGLVGAANAYAYDSTFGTVVYAKGWLRYESMHQFPDVNERHKFIDLILGKFGSGTEEAQLTVAKKLRNIRQLTTMGAPKSLWLSNSDVHEILHLLIVHTPYCTWNLVGSSYIHNFFKHPSIDEYCSPMLPFFYK